MESILHEPSSWSYACINSEGTQYKTNSAQCIRQSRVVIPNESSEGPAYHGQEIAVSRERRISNNVSGSKADEALANQTKRTTVAHTNT